MILLNDSLTQNAEALIDKEIPLVSNLSNLSRLLYEGLNNVLWAGFYLSNDKFDTLYLGPYQGPIACTTIPFNKGVCGISAHKKETIIVDNVHIFPGHIACSSLSNSEIVVPIIKNNIVYGVIDIDSTNFNNFNENDKIVLEYIANLIAEIM